MGNGTSGVSDRGNHYTGRAVGGQKAQAGNEKRQGMDSAVFMQCAGSRSGAVLWEVERCWGIWDFLM